MEFVCDAGIDHPVADLDDKAADQLFSHHGIQFRCAASRGPSLILARIACFTVSSTGTAVVSFYDLDTIIGLVLRDKGGSDLGQVTFPFLCQQ